MLRLLVIQVINISEKDQMNMNWGGKYDNHLDGNAPPFQIPNEGSGGLLSEPVASFGHPIGMSFDVREEQFETGLAPSGSFPVILIEVYSTQYFGSNRLEGYGYVSLRDNPGFQDITIATWRPVGSRSSRLTEFFIGGNPILHHPVFSEVPNKMSSSLSRFGVLTEGSGSVRFRVNTICTDPRKKQALQEKLRQAQPEGTQKAHMRRSVDDIVSHFKQVEALNKSLNRSGVFTPKAVSALGSSKSVSAGKMGASEPLSSAARADRVSQILNRARNRVSTLTKDDSSTVKTKSRIVEGGRRLPAPDDNDVGDGKDETSPLLGRPPVGKSVNRDTPGELTGHWSSRSNAHHSSDQKGKDDSAELWDNYETPVRVRRSSPGLDGPVTDFSDTLRRGMDGIESPNNVDGAEASESDPLISAPRSASGNARLRQFQREKSLSGGVGESNTDASDLPDVRVGQKFSNPKFGTRS